ncbi:MAG: beta-propeller fold lactonase family protein, partial [Phycisphaerae bacterium]|nr:beta-propeller fold lactonase family protein [Phycisphaerae bacterium]
GIPAIRAVRDIAISQDGTSLYLVCDVGYMIGSIVVFSRDTATGQLTYGQYLQYFVDGVDGLYDPVRIAVSPDGKHCYLNSGASNDATTLFSRDTSTGELTHVRSYFTGEAGWEELGYRTPVMVTPDGHCVVVGGSGESGLSIFRRDTATGELTRLNGYSHLSPGIDGLGNMQYLLLSPDGQHLYAVTDDAIVALAVGYEPLVRMDVTDSQAITGIDFAKVELISEISGRVFDDANADGLVDAGEAGLNRWSVELVDTNSGEIAAAATTTVDLDGNGTISADEGGVFSFTAVLPGDYVLRTVTEPGYTPTIPASAELPLTLRSGDSHVTDALFGMDLTNPADI